MATTTEGMGGPVTIAQLSGFTVPIDTTATGLDSLMLTMQTGGASCLDVFIQFRTPGSQASLVAGDPGALPHFSLYATQKLSTRIVASTNVTTIHSTGRVFAMRDLPADTWELRGSEQFGVTIPTVVDVLMIAWSAAPTGYGPFAMTTVMSHLFEGAGGGSSSGAISPADQKNLAGAPLFAFYEQGLLGNGQGSGLPVPLRAMGLYDWTVPHKPLDETVFSSLSMGIGVYRPVGDAQARLETDIGPLLCDPQGNLRVASPQALSLRLGGGEYAILLTAASSHTDLTGSSFVADIVAGKAFVFTGDGGDVRFYFTTAISGQSILAVPAANVLGASATIGQFLPQNQPSRPMRAPPTALGLVAIGSNATTTLRIRRV